MNLLKTAVVLLIGLFAFLDTNAQQYTMTDDLIEIRFTNKSTMSELIDVKDKLKARDIDLEYSFLSFQDEGLTGISFTIDCNENNYAGSASMIRNAESFTCCGFMRDYREDAVVSFATGVCKD